MIMTILKHLAGLLMVVFSLLVFREGRTRLEIADGIITYRGYWLLGTHEILIGKVPTSRVQKFDTESVGTRHVRYLVVFLKNGEVFYREGCMALFGPVTGWPRRVLFGAGVGDVSNAFVCARRCEKAVRTGGRFVINHYNDAAGVLSCILLLLSIRCWLVMFGKWEWLKRKAKKYIDEHSPPPPPKKKWYEEW